MLESNLVPQEMSFGAYGKEQHQHIEHSPCRPSSSGQLWTSCMWSHGHAMRCRRTKPRRQAPVDNSKRLHKMDLALHSRPVIQRRVIELFPLRVPANPAKGSQMIRWGHLASVRSKSSMSALYICFLIPTYQVRLGDAGRMRRLPETDNELCWKLILDGLAGTARWLLIYSYCC